MSPKRNQNDDNGPEASTMAEGNDAEDPRSFEHSDSERVRTGKLSAAQMADGHGCVDPENPDAQYPPGIVDNTAAALNTTDDPASFIPTRTVDQGDPEPEPFTTTNANPDYS